MAPGDSTGSPNFVRVQTNRRWWLLAFTVAVMLLSMSTSSAQYEKYLRADNSTAPRMGGQGSNCKKVLWFMGLREQPSAPDLIRYMQVAFLSARRHAPSLIPHLLFSGAPGPLTAFFERHGGRVIMHELSFEPLLRQAVKDGQHDEGWLNSRGAFLRLDVPLVFEQVAADYADDPGVDTDHFLYTDTDVLFVRDLDSCSFPETSLLSIGPEFERGHAGHAGNTGVMWANASAFAAHMPAILQHAVERGWNFGAFDQGLLINYVNDVARLPGPILPDEYNWKGYWGLGPNDQPAVYHFHGPKPERGLGCLCAHATDYEQACGGPDVYKSLFGRAPNQGMLYKHMLQAYYVLLWEAEHT